MHDITSVTTPAFRRQPWKKVCMGVQISCEMPSGEVLYF